jgi:hypothetical protein
MECSPVDQLFTGKHKQIVGLLQDITYFSGPHFSPGGVENG